MVSIVNKKEGIRVIAAFYLLCALLLAGIGSFVVSFSPMGAPQHVGHWKAICSVLAVLFAVAATGLWNPAPWGRIFSDILCLALLIAWAVIAAAVSLEPRSAGGLPILVLMTFLFFPYLVIPACLHKTSLSTLFLEEKK